MFYLSKYCTGVEKKDGTLLYQGRGFISIFHNRNKTYKIDNKTYNYLTMFVITQIFVLMPFFIWFKVQSPYLDFTTVILIFFIGIVLDSLWWKFANEFVKKSAIKKYEE